MSADASDRSAGEATRAAVVFSLERPHRNLVVYYLLASLLFGPLFLLALVPWLIRFRTLRYHFDEEGVSMRWGILFRREVSLTYTRIQDIHLASNAVERWLGLARVQIQTASGASGAEVTIEGLREFETVRDFLYSRMRGAEVSPRRVAPAPGQGTVPARELAEVTAALEAVAAELAALRSELSVRTREER